MNVSSSALLSAVQSAYSIRVSRPVAREYGLVRIRTGYGLTCVEAYNGSMMVRHHFHVENEIKLDHLFEPKPLLAWLSYVDGSVEISEKRGTVTFQCGDAKLEKPESVFLFPVRRSPEMLDRDKDEYIVLERKAWELAQSNMGDHIHGSVDLSALHAVMVDGQLYACGADGFSISVSQIEGFLESHAILPGICLASIFQAVSDDDAKIVIRPHENGFYCSHGNFEAFFPNSAGESPLTASCKAVLEIRDPFFSIDASQIVPSVEAISMAFQAQTSTDKPRAKVFSEDGKLYLVGGKLWDFYSMPIAENIPFSIPLEETLIMFDAKIMLNALKRIGGQLWFETDVTAGTTRFLVVNETHRELIMQMNLKGG